MLLQTTLAVSVFYYEHYKYGNRAILWDEGITSLYDSASLGGNKFLTTRILLYGNICMTVYRKYVHGHNYLATTNMVAQRANFESISKTVIVTGICTTANYTSKALNFEIIN